MGWAAIRDYRRGWQVAAIAAALLVIVLIGLAARRTAAPLNAATAVVAAPQIKASTVPTAPASSGSSGKSDPDWNELSGQQQQALAPLANDWHKLGPIRKKKWLVIADKFPSLSQNDQQRVQQRMIEWTKLTPQQRRLARDSYSRAKKLNPDQKFERWQQYQQLPDEQKEELAGITQKRVATLPAANNKNRTAPPIKSTSERQLSKSLKPQPAVTAKSNAHGASSSTGKPAAVATSALPAAPAKTPAPVATMPAAVPPAPAASGLTDTAPVMSITDNPAAGTAAAANNDTGTRAATD